MAALKSWLLSLFARPPPDPFPILLWSVFMKIVDLSHLMNVHTPGWVGYAGNKMYYAQNLQTKMIVAQRIDTALHVGTHIDGAMHGTDGMGDMASYPLDYLVGPGAVVDVSADIDDWAVITPEMIERQPVEVKEGDILILHTGWHRYWEGRPQQDLVRYFCMHPGGGIELLNWMLEKKIKWFGVDCGSGDHSMNTSIRHMRPDLAKRFEATVGMSCEEFFGEYNYIHKKSGRKVTENIFPFHSYAFQENLIHAENVGGDIELMLNQRAVIGAFPWRYEGLEACPCRIVCFQGIEENVEAVGAVAKAIFGPRPIASGMSTGGPDGR
jgi:kynurenine formamidase